jgi:hypothetical protein
VWSVGVADEFVTYYNNIQARAAGSPSRYTTTTRLARPDAAPAAAAVERPRTGAARATTASGHRGLESVYLVRTRAAAACPCHFTPCPAPQPQPANCLARHVPPPPPPALRRTVPHLLRVVFGAILVPARCCCL